MPSGHSDRPFATLRFRLAFWNTVGLLLLGAATLVGLRQGLHVTLSRELSRLTAEEAADLALEVQRAGPAAASVAELIDRKARTAVDRDWFGQVVGPAGRPRAASPSVPDLPWPAEPPEGPFDLDGFRVVQRQVESAPGDSRGPVLVRVGSSLRFITE